MIAVVASLCLALAGTWIYVRHARIKERREAEQREALSVLVRGLGHDFGNMIAALGMSLSLARLKLDRNDADGQHASVRQALDDAELACERSTKLCRHLVALSRGSEPHTPQVVVIGDLVATVASVCARIGNRPIEVAAAPDLWPLEGDEGSLALALWHLLVTSARAGAPAVPLSVALANVAENGNRWVRIAVAGATSVDPLALERELKGLIDVRGSVEKRAELLSLRLPAAQA